MLNTMYLMRFGGSCLEIHCEATIFLEWDMVATSAIKRNVQFQEGNDHTQQLSKEGQIPLQHQQQKKEQEPWVQHEVYGK
jgi:hypothetical protein